MATESMSDFLENQLSNRNSDGTMPSSTFNSIYWVVFSARKSDVLAKDTQVVARKIGVEPMEQLTPYISQLIHGLNHGLKEVRSKE